VGGAGGIAGGGGRPGMAGGGGTMAGGTSGKASCTAKAIATGYNHTCAVATDGALRCWGINDRGELGYGVATQDLPSPQSTNVLTGVQAVGAGYQHTCALLASGGVRCWGNNQHGELGMPTGGASGSALLAPATTDLLTGVSAIAVGDEHACGIVAADGSVRCWGAVSFVDGGKLTGVKTIASGGAHSCAVTQTGGLRCWGYNSMGQLGDGTTTDRFSSDTPDVLTDVKAVAAGHQFTCALTAAGGVRCWGNNYGGQLGDGTTAARSTPPDADVLTGVRALDCGSGYTCVITTANTVRCWGNNPHGQLGNGTFTQSYMPAGDVATLDGRCQ